MIGRWSGDDTFGDGKILKSYIPEDGKGGLFAFWEDTELGWCYQGLTYRISGSNYDRAKDALGRSLAAHRQLGATTVDIANLGGTK